MNAKSPKIGKETTPPNKAPDGSGGGSGQKVALLAEYVNSQVSVITNDGRNIVGTMRGFDQVCNVILEKSVERVFSTTAGVQTVALGMYVVRGDNIAVIGKVDAEKDSKVPWGTVKVSFPSFLTV